MEQYVNIIRYLKVTPQLAETIPIITRMFGKFSIKLKRFVLIEHTFALLRLRADLTLPLKDNAIT